MESSPVSGKDNLEVTGVSRSGRVRKKSSKLLDFQSPDDIDTAKVLKRTAHKSPSTKIASQRSATNSGAHSKSSIKAYFQPVVKATNSSHTTNNLLRTPNKHEKPEVAIDKQIDMLLSSSKYSADDDDDVDDDDDDDAMNVDNNNDVDSDEDFELAIDTTMRKSAYMSEKSSKKKIFKDGEIVLSRPQRKDKGKPRFTAYMLWAKEARQELQKSNPNMDFSQASRRLSKMWAIVPNNEKNIWRRRAKRVTVKNKKALKTGDKLTTKYLNKPGQKKPGRKPKRTKDTKPDVIPSPSPSKKTKSDRRSTASNSSRDEDLSKQKSVLNNSNNLSAILPGAYKVTGIGPTEVAAHLKLLGDNLAIIGQRLKEHEGQITVSGSLSVLLDSLLCSLGPLMCLTTIIPEVDEPGHLKDTLVNILDNIAYVMPGL
ncbi:HMG box-containing protein 4 [Sitodiplosis mosellana]|uniref:HMG box-containing protein 4 n=1 Tax=Sitodiplosis mosellana TaxID=263140 RepID=UPI00244442EE|nr:HMG box-containing protein 4 [Sitodiplosis mosellana]